MSSPPDHDEALWRLAAATAIWAGSYAALSAWGIHLVPLSLARHLTLQAYLGLIQLVTLGVGLGAAFAVLVHPAEAIPLRPQHARAVIFTVALTPAVFSLVTTTAFLVARPTLIAELMVGGRAAVQQNSGQFGRELAGASAWLTLLWAAVVTPLVEELFFRGVLFTAFARVVKSGILTAVLVAALFGWLHWDMSGGLGIVRLVSALGLGLACGIARYATGSVAPAIVLHSLFNFLSVASVRRWVVTETLPTKYSAPTLVTAIGCAGVVGVLGTWWWLRRRPPASTMSLR